MPTDTVSRIFALNTPEARDFITPPTSDLAAGRQALELYVHGPDAGPGDQFYVLMPTWDVQLTVTTRRVVSFSRPGAECRPDPDYSTYWCSQRCINGRAANRSGCQPWGQVADSPAPFCARSSELHQFYVDWLQAVTEPCRHCPKQCAVTEHDIFVNEQSASRMPRYPQRNIRLKIRIANRMEVVEEQLAYTASDLLADIGGNIGLLLGYSGFAVIDLACRLVDWMSARPSARAHTVSKVAFVEQ
ncbi:acid-sensing ion channel 3-like [Pollicipes pollicipes]|uniref:acid-sensing ion channel 3-like n=1 Tax=Pollicipes pollicipes TaxID=41117 RepID=UPI0018855A68|nr:acid-sensing ion channel 3-like [Pollicipes pollicipes]